MRTLAALAVCLSLGSALLGCNLNPQPFPPQSNDNGGPSASVGGGSGGGGGSSGGGVAQPTGGDGGGMATAAGDASSAPVVADASVGDVTSKLGAEGGTGFADAAGVDAMGSCLSCSGSGRDGSAAEAGPSDDAAAEAAPEDDAPDESDSNADAATGTGP